MDSTSQLGKLLVWDVYGSAGAGSGGGTVGTGTRDIFSVAVGGNPKAFMFGAVYGTAGSGGGGGGTVGTGTRDIFSIIPGGNQDTFMFGAVYGTAGAGGGGGTTTPGTFGAPTGIFSRRRRGGRR